MRFAQRVSVAPMPLLPRYCNNFKEWKRLSSATCNDKFSGNGFISFVTTDPRSPSASTVLLFPDYGSH